MPNIDAMRYVFALMLGLGLALLPAGRLVRAQGLPDALISAQIVPGWRLPDGQQMVALHVRLAQNWKTYWRAPGAAGVAPRFAWAGSQNLRGVQILWPVPQVFDLGWIFPDQDGREIANGRLDHPGPARGFAHAINALIGEDFDKEPVARFPATAGHAGVHEIGFDFGNFHTVSSASAISSHSTSNVLGDMVRPARRYQ